MAEKTALQKMTELKAAGWNGVGDINQVYARTATQADGGNAPNPVSAPAQPQSSTTAAPTNQGGTYSATGVYQPSAAERAKQEAAVLAGFKESSGFSREELAEKKREFDATLAQKEAEWTRDGLPRLVIAQRLADLEDAKFRETVQQFQSTQGLEYLKFASTLRGPADYFQSVDFNRGAQQRGDVPTFLNALSSNTQLPTFQSAGTVPQQGLTPGVLASGLTGGTPAPGGTTAAGYNPDQALNQIGSIFKSGPSALGVGSLERLDPNELALLKSGAGKLGYDYDSWIRNYQRSGVGQSAGVV